MEISLLFSLILFAAHFVWNARKERNELLVEIFQLTFYKRFGGRDNPTLNIIFWFEIITSVRDKGKGLEIW